MIVYTVVLPLASRGRFHLNVKEVLVFRLRFRSLGADGTGNSRVKLRIFRQTAKFDSALVCFIFQILE